MMNLRCAAAADCAAVCAFYDEVIDALAGAQYSPGWAKDIYPDRAVLEGFIRRGEMYIGEKSGRIACALAVDASDGCLGVHMLAVHPDLRGLQLGKAMVRFAIHRAEQLGMRKICLDVTEGNLPAEKLYSGMGFEFVKARRDWFTDEEYMDFREYEYRVKKDRL